MEETYDNIEFTYDSQKRKHPAIEELVDIVRYRDMLFQFVRRDIVTRYKRSALGVAWTMVQPLGMMAVMTIVFSQLFHRVDGFASHLLSGLVAWTFFGQTTTASLINVTGASMLMRKIYMPHTAFPVSSVMTGVINLALSTVPLVVINLIVGRPLTWALLFTPLAILILAAFALGVSLMLATFAVYFPDIKEMYQIILQAWMYLTPIIYPETILPDAYRFWILHLNPMYYMIRLFRDPVYDGTLPPADILIASILIAVVSLLAGWVYFSKEADTFAYKI